MKKIIFFCVVILNLTFVSDVYASAKCELVMDADSGRVLYSKNANEERLIASTTKIMTSLVVLNNVRTTDIVTIGDEVLDAYGSAIYIKPKEKLTVLDLLYGLMLRSGNDAAISLAVYTAGSIEAFANMMNNTVFKNPHGLDEETQNTSTVYDMALLMREAMKNPEFRKITSAKKYTLQTNFNTYEWYNKNKLLINYKYATGGKIGYTTSAKHTFVSSASKDNKNLIVATFVDDNRFVTHEELYERFFELYKRYTLIDKDRLNIDYKRGYKLFTMESYSMLLKKDEIEKVNREIVLYNDVDIGENATVIGTISITIDGTIYKKMNIYALSTKKDNISIIDKIKELFKW